MLIFSPMNTKFQLIFFTRYYNKHQNAVNIHFSASSKFAIYLLKNLTWLSSFHMVRGSGSTKLWFNITTFALLDKWNVNNSIEKVKFYISIVFYDEN